MKWLCARLWTVVYQASLSTGIFQARILEWVALFFSRGSSRPRDWTTSLMSPELADKFFTTNATWEGQRQAKWQSKQANVCQCRSWFPVYASVKTKWYRGSWCCALLNWPPLSSDLTQVPSNWGFTLLRGLHFPSRQKTEKENEAWSSVGFSFGLGGERTSGAHIPLAGIQLHAPSNLREEWKYSSPLCQEAV